MNDYPPSPDRQPSRPVPNPRAYTDDEYAAPVMPGSIIQADRAVPTTPAAAQPPVIRAEFVPESFGQAPPAEPTYQGAPIHPLAALGTIVLDLMWGAGEVGGTATVIGVVAVPVLMLCTGTLAFWLTLTIQRFVARDGWGAALAKALVMAVIAGVPFPIAGTAVGSVMLAWAGLSVLGKR